MPVNTIGITKEQQEFLYYITKLFNEIGRYPTYDELIKETGLTEGVVRGKLQRLKKRNFIIEKDGRTTLNEAELVTRKETAKAILEIGPNIIKKKKFIQILKKNKGIEKDICADNIFEKLLKRLIRDGYIQETEAMPGFINHGQAAGDLSLYLEMLASKE